MTITIAISIKGAKGQVELINTPVNYKTLAQANSEYDNKAINTNLAVGAIEGKFEVTLSGAATYRIKPDLLPGIKNMVPNIEIIYSSQAGNSMLGEGWSIQGLSAIARTSKDIYHNGRNENIKFDNSDYLSLDGQLLSPYGNTGEYRTVNETYNIIKIIWGYNGYTDCPNYFTVETKDGMILEYGNSNDSKVHTKSPKGSGTLNNVVAWKISKMTDKYGNYILFKYKNIAPNTTSTPTHVIDEISYTHNNALSTAVINKLKFNYKLRRDINSGFISGDEYGESYVLTSIETFSGNLVNNKMHFAYGYSENSSKVIEVTKENKNGELLNSTKFKYNEINIAPTQNAINNNVATNENVDERRYADFNGDGYSDYITTFKTTDATNSKKYINKHEVFLNNKSGGFYLAKTINNVYQLDRTFALNPISHSRLVVDVNGDNLQDIIFFKINNGSQKIVQYYYLYYDQVTSQFKESERTIVHLGKLETFPWYDFNPIANPDYALTGEEWQTLPSGKNWINFGDFNGDGRTEMILNVEFKLTETWTNTQTGSSGVQYINYAYVYAFLIDPNISTISSSNIITYPSAILSASMLTLIDIDGDSRQEILVLDTKTIYEYDETSKTFIVKKAGLNIPGIPNMNTRIELGDFNGDKKTDILYYNLWIHDQPSNSSPSYNFNQFYDIYYSNGLDFQSPKRNLNVPFTDVDWSDCDLGIPNPDDPMFNIIDAVKAIRDFTVSDFNYDGKTDIIEYLSVEKCENNQIVSRNYERIYYSNGDGFDMHNVSNSLTNTSSSSNNQDKRKLGDFNGDGFIDVFYHGSTGTSITQFNLSNMTNPKSSSCRLLSGIKNGYNYEIKIDYDRLTNSIYSNQYRSCSYPQAYNFKIPARLVSAYQIPDGIGGEVNNTYKYYDLYFDYHSGFKGFGKVIAKALPTNTYVETWLTYNKDYKQLFTSRLENGILLNGGYEAISHTNYEMEFKDYSNASAGIGSKRFIQVPNKITKYNYLTQHEDYTNYSYDSKTNEYRLLSTTENTNNSLNIQSTQLLNYGAFGTTLSNKPQTTIKTNTRLGKPSVSAEHQYSYNSTTGDLEYEIINKNLPCETKISYDYDVVGNIWKKTTLPIGSAANPIYCGTDRRISL